jgi:hypothetical protein
MHRRELAALLETFALTLTWSNAASVEGLALHSPKCKTAGERTAAASRRGRIAFSQPDSKSRQTRCRRPGRRRGRWLARAWRGLNSNAASDRLTGVLAVVLTTPAPADADLDALGHVSEVGIRSIRGALVTILDRCHPDGEGLELALVAAVVVLGDVSHCGKGRSFSGVGGSDLPALGRNDLWESPRR